MGNGVLMQPTHIYFLVTAALVVGMVLGYAIFVAQQQWRELRASRARRAFISEARAEETGQLDGWTEADDWDAASMGVRLQ